MSSPPMSARPPRPNVVPEVRLGDPKVEAFLGKAAGGGEGAPAAPPPEPSQGMTAPPALAVASPPPPPAGPPPLAVAPPPALTVPPPLTQPPSYTPAAPPKEAMRAWTMRLPPDIHANLKWIADNGGPSMNEFILQALRDALPPAIEKLTRAQAMGLFLKRGRGS